MSATYIVFKREFLSFFRSPVAYVFLAAFLIAAITLTWYPGQFFDSNNASLEGFFTFIPWIFLILIPASGMRLWAEERRAGTWELLFTMPLSVGQAVLGKFLAGWAFVSLAILLTFTLPVTASFLGDPDWGPIFTGYFGSILMAGAYLSVCSLTSAFTKNQVISFVISFVICMVLVFLGFSMLNEAMLELGWPVWLVDSIANFSFITHFEPMQQGLIAVRDVLFFFALMAFCLALNVVVLER